MLTQVDNVNDTYNTKHNEANGVFLDFLFHIHQLYYLTSVRKTLKQFFHALSVDSSGSKR